MDGADNSRSRRYEWLDPGPMAADGFAMAGLDFLRTCMEQNLVAPIAATMDFRLTEVAEGRAVFAGAPAEFHYNPIGTVHGGYFATLLDSSMGCAVHTTLPAGLAYTTLEFKINLVRPLTTKVDQVSCEGWVVHRGGRVATAEGRIVDSAGKIYAHGSTTCMIFKLPEANGPGNNSPETNGNGSAGK